MALLVIILGVDADTRVVEDCADFGNSDQFEVRCECLDDVGKRSGFTGARTARQCDSDNSIIHLDYEWLFIAERSQK